MTDAAQASDLTGVTILGSANLDVVFSVARIPEPGETLIADRADRYPGGKGLNQAVAAARAGAATTFVGALGRDENGDLLADTMAAAGVAGDLVRRVSEPTGQAFIVVDDSGENTIIVASGANGTVTRLTDEENAAIAASAVLLMQLELPLPAIEAAALIGRQRGVVTMLNAAPARELPLAMLEDLDYLIVNEHEACLIAGSDDLETASVTLAGLASRLVVTLGSSGSVLYDGGVEVARIPAMPVTAIDTTGAGDTYCGAFAAAIAEGMEYGAAARFATAAAALSVQSIGAVPSVPMRDAIDASLGVVR
ncbi:MAG: ribokinase [Microbacteriaceae bacterium]|jgi:ribokinase|nr:ribokinase [Microbacteriaceae bacterium]